MPSVASDGQPASVCGVPIVPTRRTRDAPSAPAGSISYHRIVDSTSSPDGSGPRFLAAACAAYTRRVSRSENVLVIAASPVIHRDSSSTGVAPPWVPAGGCRTRGTRSGTLRSVIDPSLPESRQRVTNDDLPGSSDVRYSERPSPTVTAGCNVTARSPVRDRVSRPVNVSYLGVREQSYKRALGNASTVDPLNRSRPKSSMSAVTATRVSS